MEDETKLLPANGVYSAIWLQADPDNMEHMNEVWAIQGFFSHYR